MTNALKVFFGPVQQVNTLTDSDNDGKFDIIDGSNVLYMGSGTPFVIKSIQGWEGRPAIDTSQIMRPQRHGAWFTEMLAQPRVISLDLEVVADNVAVLPGTNNTVYRQSLIDHMAITTKEYVFGVDMGFDKPVEFVFGRVTDFRMNTDTWYHKHQNALIEFTATDPRKFLGDPTALYSAVQKSVSAYLDVNAGSSVTSNYPYNYSFLYGGFPTTILARNYFTNPSFAADPSGTKAVVRRNYFYNPSLPVNALYHSTDAGTGVTSRTNLFLNPSFENGSALTTVRTNMALNPSFEAAGANNVYRTNLATDPNSNRGNTGNFGFDFGGGAGTSAWVNASGAIGNGYIRQTWTTASTSSICGTYGNQFNCTAGVTYTWSAYVRCSIAQTFTLGVDWRNSGGTIIAQSRATTISVPANTWTRIYQTAAAPATATQGTLTYFGASGASLFPVNATLDVDNTLVEATSTLNPYFDGDTGVVGEWNHAWSGTANNSTSVEQQLTVANVTPSANAVAYQSSSWKNSRSYSMRVSPTTATNDSFAAIGGDIGGMRLGMVAGQTYTASATCRLNAPLTGTLVGSQALTVTIYWKTSGGTYQSVSSSQAPNSVGQTRLSVTGTIPAGATEAFVRLYNGASVGNGDVWWDDVLVEQSTAAGTYFDGNTASTADYSYAWTGTAEASSSIFRAALATSVSSGPNAMVTQATSWTSSRLKSIRITPNAASNDSYADISAMVSVSPNPTLTFSGTVRLSSALAGSLSSYALKPRVSYGGTEATINYSATATNTPGTYRVVGKFTKPAGTLDYFRLYNGASIGNGDVWWDDIVLEDSVITTGGYFDGSTSQSGDVVYSWVGTADNSTSVAQIPQGRVLDSGNPVGQYVYRSAWVYGTTTKTGGFYATVRSNSASPNFAQSGHMFSVYVRTNFATYLKPTVEWYNVNTLVNTDTSSSVFQIPANQWVRVYALSTPGSTSANNAIFRLLTDATSGSLIPDAGKIDVIGLMVENSPTVNLFFDGSNNDTATEIYDWVSGTGTSESTLSASPVLGVTGSNVATPYYDFNDTKGMTLTPNTTNNDSKATATIDPSKIAELAGKTVGLSAICRINKLLTGTLSANALKLGVTVTSTGAGTVTYWSTALDNSTPITGLYREQRLNTTLTLPVDTTAITLVYMNGASSGNGSVHWDKAIFSIGPYSDYFDGYYTPNPKYSSYWEGTPYQSSSVLMQPTIGQNIASFNVTGNTDARVIYTITGAILNPTIKVTDSKGTRSITFNTNLTNTMGSIVLDPFNGFVTLNGSNAMYLISGRSPYDFELAPGPVVVEFTGTNFTYASLAINWLSATI